MILVWILTFILAGLHWQPAMDLWQWYGDNWLITALLLIFFA